MGIEGKGKNSEKEILRRLAIHINSYNFGQHMQNEKGEHRLNYISKPLLENKNR
jgi:hypothetical protein